MQTSQPHWEWSYSKLYKLYMYYLSRIDESGRLKPSAMSLPNRIWLLPML